VNRGGGRLRVLGILERANLGSAWSSSPIGHLIIVAICLVWGLVGEPAEVSCERLRRELVRGSVVVCKLVVGVCGLNEICVGRLA
jgi:hypothetical protein